MRNVTQGAAVVSTHHAQCGTSPRLGTLEFVERPRCGYVAALSTDQAWHVRAIGHLIVSLSRFTMRAPFTGSPARMAALIFDFDGVGGLGSLHSSAGHSTP